MKVIAIEDHGVVPSRPEDANYSPEVAGSRTDLRPLEIRQPGGRASRWKATSCPGRSGGCASVSLRARGPVTYIGFALKPVGFFDRNPALDVPRPEGRSCGHHAPGSCE
jgi:Cu2+-containing amine oxidase